MSTRKVLVLQCRRAPVPISPRSQVPGLGWPGTSHVEEDSEVVREEAPSVRAMFEDSRAAPAILTLLRNTRVGKMASLAPRGENWWEDSESEGEEGGPGPP